MQIAIGIYQSNEPIKSARPISQTNSSVQPPLNLVKSQHKFCIQRLSYSSWFKYRAKIKLNTVQNLSATFANEIFSQSSDIRYNA